MRDVIDRLSAREREVLRLLVGGHQAKSIARELGISVHTVNERLREARRKLAVSTSREAARILAAHENAEDPPKNVGDKEIGVGPLPWIEADAARSGNGRAAARPALVSVALGGTMMMVLIAGVAAALVTSSQGLAPGDFADAGKIAAPGAERTMGEAHPAMLRRVKVTTCTSGSQRVEARPGQSCFCLRSGCGVKDSR